MGRDGHPVESIDYRETKDPDVRVSMLLKVLEKDKELKTALFVTGQVIR
jgi:hypothetical protein